MDSDIDPTENLKQVIRNTPYDLLQENIYVCFANGCLLLTSFLTLKGQPGWSSQLIDETGQPMLSAKEQEMLESSFSKAPWLWEMFATIGKKEGDQEEQRGGAAVPDFSAAGSSLAGSLREGGLTGDDVSLDAGFQKFLDYTTKLDERAQQFKYEGVGATLTKFLNSDIVIPIGGPAGIPIPKKPLFLFVMALLDMFRMTQALQGEKSNMLTLLVFLEELVTGQWRQMMLTATGFLSPSGVAFSVIGKYIINAWLLINPSLRDTLMRDIYKGTKSMVIGFLLWAASILPPSTLKAPIQESFAKVSGMVAGLGEKLKTIEEEASRPLAATGKRIKFTEINTEKLSRFTLEDIQNLQALSQWNTIVCTKEYQEILEPLKKEPIFRLIIELLGIPTTEEDKLQACGAGPLTSVSEKVQELLQPGVVNAETPVPSMSGGNAKRKTRGRQKKRKPISLRRQR